MAPNASYVPVEEVENKIEELIIVESEDEDIDLRSNDSLPEITIDDINWDFEQPWIQLDELVHSVIMGELTENPRSGEDWKWFNHVYYAVVHTNTMGGTTRGPINVCIHCCMQYVNMRKTDRVFDNIYIQKWEGEEAIQDEHTIIYIQDRDYWCSQCYTSNCFYLTDCYAPTHIRNLSMTYTITEQTVLKYVDGEWRSTQN